MSNKDSSFCFFLIGTIIYYVICITVVKASPKSSQWTYEKCYTNSCIEEKLNSLPAEIADSAKLTTWEDKTYVWYRKN